MKIGIFAMLSEKTIDPVSAARRCEELGFESFWAPEHAIINSLPCSRIQSQPRNRIRRSSNENLTD
jgi:alkanesulfonate monooxygenase SsuD/methylene tetrahydromethanopterin reductase-like flavin-dependent oxidoreductase (luciferase family)